MRAIIVEPTGTGDGELKVMDREWSKDGTTLRNSQIYRGQPSECLAFIKLTEDGYFSIHSSGSKLRSQLYAQGKNMK